MLSAAKRVVNVDSYAPHPSQRYSRASKRIHLIVIPVHLTFLLLPCTHVNPCFSCTHVNPSHRPSRACMHACTHARKQQSQQQARDRDLARRVARHKAVLCEHIPVGLCAIVVEEFLAVAHSPALRSRNREFPSVALIRSRKWRNGVEGNGRRERVVIEDVEEGNDGRWAVLQGGRVGATHTDGRVEIARYHLQACVCGGVRGAQVWAEREQLRACATP